jgi:hypothetical protein
MLSHADEVSGWDGQLEVNIFDSTAHGRITGRSLEQRRLEQRVDLNQLAVMVP